MKKTKERFVCWIWVAPFVKRYLLNNFRVEDPVWPELVSFSSDKFVVQVFRSMLIKPSRRYDYRTGTCRYRSCRVPVEISKSDFYRYGWALSPTDESLLSGMLEARCRTLLKEFLRMAALVTPSVSQGIKMFYEAYGFDDSCWPENSIRRIWDRAKHKAPLRQHVSLSQR